MTTDDVRRSAYAELVSGLIDARDRSADQRFDAELAAAVAAGLLDAETARTLRWWQRETLRAVVDQATQVVPPTLAALEAAAEQLRQRVASQPGAQPTGARRTGEWAFEPVGDTEDSSGDLVDEQLPPPADLTARRLLVAGLRPLRDP